MKQSKLALALAALLFSEGAAWADKIKHPTAVFAGLDKITGRIISFEVSINETVQFGSLQITPRVCFSRPTTEAPRTDAFAEVDEVDSEKKVRRIFTGWMFADSPGLHGVEHPVYDIWLTDCKGDGPVIKEAPETVETSPDDDSDKPATPDAGATPGATPGAAQTPKPVKTRRPKPKPANLEPPADVGGAPPPDNSQPGPPLHIGR